MSTPEIANLTAGARAVVKALVLRSPLGPFLQSLRRKRRSVRELRGWTAGDDVALRFYAQFIGTRDVCFDIGANRGSRTKVFRRLASKVVAVEPQSLCMAVLRAVYANDARVVLVNSACGAEPGMAKLHISPGMDVLSSLSDEWIRAVERSGRFKDASWTKEEACAVVTLHELIRTHGAPSFIKIDVEGYELNVLRGLKQPVRSLSFEFAPERTDATIACIDQVAELGPSEFNLSWNESFQLSLGSWVGRDEIVALLNSYRDNTEIFGDVYARSR